MRRKDREINRMSQLVEIMRAGEFASLAFRDEEYPYVIPVNYGVGLDEDGLCLYFHGAGAGRKMELLARDNRVGFAIVGSHRMELAKPACRSTMRYASVCGSGRILAVDSEEEKLSALTLLMGQYSGEESFDFDEVSFAHTTILKLCIDEIHGKSNMERQGEAEA